MVQKIHYSTGNCLKAGNKNGKVKMAKIINLFSKAISLFAYK